MHHNNSFFCLVLTVTQFVGANVNWIKKNIEGGGGFLFALSSWTLTYIIDETIYIYIYIRLSPAEPLFAILFPIVIQSECFISFRK